MHHPTCPTIREDLNLHCSVVSDSLKGNFLGGYLNDYQLIWKTLLHGISYRENKWKYRLPLLGIQFTFYNDLIQSAAI